MPEWPSCVEPVNNLVLLYMLGSEMEEAAETIPVSVITGFLGSGKTTLLNHILKHPDMAETAVIVNEFGEIGIDHLLVETALEDAVLLRSGCVCCTIRGDLIDTLDLLRIRRGRGEIPAFRRVAIETTGLADPAPVLQTLMSAPTITAHYRLAGMVATVDAVNGLNQIEAHVEAKKQAVLAGRLLVTKGDIASTGALAALDKRLAQLNPTAARLRVDHGRIAPDAIFEDGRYDPASIPEDVSAWPAHEGDHEHGHRHGAGIQTFCLTRDGPIAWRALHAWLDSITSLRGADVLRIKGIVDLGDGGGPLVLHGVQHVFHAPRRLDRWPDEDRRSRIVCITNNIAEDDLAKALDAAVEFFDARQN